MKFEHIVIILVAFVAALAFYAVLVIVTGSNPKFIEATVAALGGGLLGAAKT